MTRFRYDEPDFGRRSAADMVNQPPHYKVGGVETIDYLAAKLSPEEFAGFCKGNALKYISRAGHKGDAAEDMRKAVWYLERLLRQGATQKAQPKTVEQQPD